MICDIMEEKKKNGVLVLCIGTDRSTGDSLGPLTGYKLKEQQVHRIQIIGTLERPVHAMNLEQSMAMIRLRYPDHVIIAVDASVFFLILTGRGRQVLGSDELRCFLGVVAVATLLVFLAVLPSYDSAGRALLDSLFQVSSIISTSGFATANYDLWPTMAKIVLILVMFIGGCAGSTAGGLKCSRVLLLVRCAWRSLSRVLHPRAVKVVKLDGKAVDEDTLSTLSAFVTLFFLTLGGTCLVVSLDGFSPTTSFSASLACLSNIGPGLEMVGPAGNFAAFSPLSKLVLTLAMLVGRLEIFPILILLHPATWRRT